MITQCAWNGLRSVAGSARSIKLPSTKSRSILPTKHPGFFGAHFKDVVLHRSDGLRSLRLGSYMQGSIDGKELVQEPGIELRKVKALVSILSNPGWKILVYMECCRFRLMLFVWQVRMRVMKFDGLVKGYKGRTRRLTGYQDRDHSHHCIPHNG